MQFFATIVSMAFAIAAVSANEGGARLVKLDKARRNIRLTQIQLHKRHRHSNLLRQPQLDHRRNRHRRTILFFHRRH